MIKYVVLDMGNVLLTYDPEIPLNLFCKTGEARDRIRKELFEGPEWILGDYGTITNSERFEPVSKRIPACFHEELRQCVDDWKICMQPVPGAKEFCRYARDKGYGVYVLSNACNMFHEYFPRFEKESWFDGVMVSSDVHMIKPEPSIYRLFLKTYRLEPWECLFIDDRPENVEGAVKEGMGGFVFQNDFEAVKKYLYEKGLK